MNNVFQSNILNALYLIHVIASYVCYFSSKICL